MTRPFVVAGSLLVAGLVALGCKDDSGNGAGNPGAAGSSGSAGSGGGGTGGGGGAAGTPGFMSIAPCPNQSDYTMGNTVDFGLINGAYAYSPKCLTLTLPATGGAGLEVTFTGDFVAHPLEPSALRGAQSGNPITATSAGASKIFRFTTPGFFAYFCDTHNPSDNGAAMSGVVWVTQQELLP